MLATLVLHLAGQIERRVAGAERWEALLDGRSIDDLDVHPETTHHLVDRGQSGAILTHHPQHPGVVELGARFGQTCICAPVAVCLQPVARRGDGLWMGVALPQNGARGPGRAFRYVQCLVEHHDAAVVASADLMSDRQTHDPGAHNDDVDRFTHEALLLRRPMISRTRWPPLSHRLR